MRAILHTFAPLARPLHEAIRIACNRQSVSIKMRRKICRARKTQRSNVEAILSFCRSYNFQIDTSSNILTFTWFLFLNRRSLTNYICETIGNSPLRFHVSYHQHHYNHHNNAFSRTAIVPRNHRRGI